MIGVMKKKDNCVWCVRKKIGHFDFSSWLPPLFFESWMGVIEEVFAHRFENQDDKISWRWSGKKVFTTKSVYEHLTASLRGPKFAHIWKAKIPYKVKKICIGLQQQSICMQFHHHSPNDPSSFTLAKKKTTKAN